LSQRILITGGAGFIGHHVVKGLLNNSDSKIVVVDNLSNPNRNFQIDKDDRRITFYKEDVRNKETIDDIVKGEKIDTCIHLAAKISVNESILNPFETAEVNVMGTLCVLDACAKNNVATVVFVSSAAVYGETKVLPITEDHFLEPLLPYGASKVAGEALVSSYRNSDKIQDAIWLRLFSAFGLGQTAEYAGVITRFRERLERQLPPIIFGDGKQSRDFVSVKDIVRAIIAAMEANVSGVFDVGTGRSVSINDLARIMIRESGLNLDPIHDISRDGEILHSCANTARLKQVLTFNTLYEVESELKSLVNCLGMPDDA